MNDLKRAAAAFDCTHTKEVSTFRRAKETLALIARLASGDTPRSAVIETLPSRRGGTIACEQVALAFAHWVGREFCAAVTHALQVAQSPSIGREHINQNKKGSNEMDHSTNQTNNGLIPVFSGTMQGQAVQLCNARDLHTFLQVGKDFSNWIKDRLETYGFIESEDYSPILANRSGDTVGKRRTDYHLTLDTAKEIAMVEKNDQGRQARRYFIACEKKLAHVSSQTAALPPPIENALPYDIEKACDFRSWKLANEYHQHTMQLIGNAARFNDEPVMSESSFLVKRRLYERLVGFAQIQLEKKSPVSFITDLVLSWQP